MKNVSLANVIVTKVDNERVCIDRARSTIIAVHPVDSQDEAKASRQ
jgi:hypothetical protein